MKTAKPQPIDSVDNELDDILAVFGYKCDQTLKGKDVSGYLGAIESAKQQITQLINQKVLEGRIDQAEHDYWQYRPLSEEDNFVEGMQQTRDEILAELSSAVQPKEKK